MIPHPSDEERDQSIEVIDLDGKVYNYRAITKEEWNELVEQMNIMKEHVHDKAAALEILHRQLDQHEQRNSRRFKFIICLIGLIVLYFGLLTLAIIHAR